MSSDQSQTPYCNICALSKNKLCFSPPQVILLSVGILGLNLLDYDIQKIRLGVLVISHSVKCFIIRVTCYICIFGLLLWFCIDNWKWWAEKRLSITQFIGLPLNIIPCHHYQWYSKLSCFLSVVYRSQDSLRGPLLNVHTCLWVWLSISSAWL